MIAGFAEDDTAAPCSDVRMGRWGNGEGKRRSMASDEALRYEFSVGKRAVGPERVFTNRACGVRPGHLRALKQDIRAR